jgi:hypothetical protein
MYTNYPNSYNGYNYNGMNNSDERFFWAPFVVGGLAGTALGYGIANNNQINNQPVAYYVPPYQSYQTYPIYPTYSNSTNYFY